MIRDTGAVGRIWRDKRGMQVSWYAVLWVLWRALVTLGVVILLVVFARSYVDVRQDTFHVQSAMFVDGLLLDGPGLVVENHTFRRLPGVVDGKFGLLELDSDYCFGSCQSVPFAAKINVGGAVWWYHRKEYDLLSKVPVGLSGPGGVRREVFRRAVVVRGSDGVLRDAVLVADVVSARGG